MRENLTELDRQYFASPLKYSFLSVMNEEGYPHTNLIMTLEGAGEKQMMFGQNYSGETKTLYEKTKKAGFMSLSLDMKLWTGKLSLSSIETKGANLDYFNSRPATRYNSYFNFKAVYQSDILGIDGPSQLDMAEIMPLVHSIVPKIPEYATGGEDGPITGVTQEIVVNEKCGKLIAWQGEDGIPQMAPVFAAVPAGSERMLFSMDCAPELHKIPQGAKVSLHCMVLTTLEAVQLRGTFHQSENVGWINVEQVYCPMVPVSGVIYPRIPIAAVTQF